jgi:hypothetical protein
VGVNLILWTTRPILEEHGGDFSGFFHFPQRTPSCSTSSTSSLRRPSRGQHAFGSHNEFAPSTHYGQGRSFFL